MFEELLKTEQALKCLQFFLLSAVSYELSLNPTQLHRSLCLASREKI